MRGKEIVLERKGKVNREEPPQAILNVKCRYLHFTLRMLTTP